MNLHYLTERLPKPDYERGGAPASITSGTFRGRGAEDVYQNLPSSESLKGPRKRKKPIRLVPNQAPRSLPPQRSAQGGESAAAETKEDQEPDEPEPTQPTEDLYPTSRYRLKKSRKPSMARLRASAINSQSQGDIRLPKTESPLE